MGGKLVIAFPGTGFTTRETLFQECFSAFQSKGYQVVQLDFSMIPFKEIETIPEAVEAANRQVVLQLKNIRFEEYDDVVFLSKSLGTVCAGWLEGQRGCYPRQLYLTPIRETLAYIRQDSRVLALVLGDKDRLMSVEELEEFCAPRGLRMVTFAGVGHSLKDDKDPARTQSIAAQVAALC